MSDAMVQARIAALSPERRALLARMLGQSAAPPPPRLVPDPRDDAAPTVEAPLSPVQHRFWTLQELAPDSVAYVGAIAMRLRGPLDTEALTRALHAVARRQAVLRTLVVTDADGAPRQRVLPPAAVERIVVEPLAALSPTSPDRVALAIAQRCTAWARRPFQLATDLPLRAALLPVEPDDHAFLLALHHVADDEWSRQLLWRELSAAYAAVVAGADPVQALPLPPFQYADWAATPEVQSPPAAASVDYWREQLTPRPEPLALPFGRRRPAEPGRDARVVESFVPDAELAGLRALSRAEGTTLFATLLTLFQLTLARLGDQRDVVVGVPATGRTARPELEQLLGVFVHTLPMRLRLGDGATFRTLLRENGRRVPLALEHASVPFERMLALAGSARAVTHAPLVQALFALDRPAVAEPLGNATAAPIEVRTGEAKVDLFLAAREQDGGLRLRLEVTADALSHDDAAGVLEILRRLARAVGDQPDAPVWTPPLLDPSTAVAALGLAQRGAAAGRPPLVERTIPALVAEWAARRPATVAVELAGSSMHARAAGDDASCLTYGALHEQANRLAWRLGACGVSRGARVALLLDRGPRAVTALLGVLTAGAAYVPLDPTHPAPWLARLLDDAMPAVLLTERAHVEAARQAAAAVERPLVLLVLDDPHEQAALATQPCVAPAVPLGPDDAAYVVYTSGSTGVPKGVVVRHGSIHALVADQPYAPLGPDSVVGQAATLAFDAATFEIWGPLVTGGRCVVLPTDTLLDPLALDDAIRAHAVETLFLTTALFNAVARTRPASLGGLRTLLFGGEAADAHSVRCMREALPALRLVNVYGPTEATTFAAWHEVGDGAVEDPVPIGRPIARTALYVLDERLAVLPPGMVGELCIAGPGVALGYLDRPELTAERFVPAPWDATGATRLYRTGDRCRWRDDGALEFVGRADAQVKIRGFRVEPAAVEQALLRDPRVMAAAVVVHDEGDDGRRLVAYAAVTDTEHDDAAGQADRSARELMTTLRTTLPPYLLPSSIVVLPSLPRTANGKLDRAALAALTAADAPHRSTRDGDGDADDPVVADLCRHFAAVLELETVGPHDDFFVLGGHSLRALRLVARLERATGVSITATTLFVAPTPLRLAERLRAGETAASEVVHLRRGSRPPFFFLHGDFVGGGVYCAQLVEQWRAPHGFSLLPLQEPVPGATVEAMAREQVARVRALQPTGPYHLGGHCNGGIVAYEMARQLRAAGEMVAFLLVLDAFVLNAHLGWLHTGVELVGAARGWSLAERQRRFLDLREAHRDRLERLAWRTPLQLLAHVVRKAPVVLARAARPTRSASGHDAAAAGPPVADPAGDRWRAVLGAYVPRPYDGPLVLGMAADGAQEAASRASVAGWRRLAPRSRLELIPGGHLEMRSGVGAATVRRLLDEALGGEGRG